jgi:hypothetical protein
MNHNQVEMVEECIYNESSHKNNPSSCRISSVFIAIYIPPWEWPDIPLGGVAGFGAAGFGAAGAAGAAGLGAADGRVPLAGRLKPDGTVPLAGVGRPFGALREC